MDSNPSLVSEQGGVIDLFRTIGGQPELMACLWKLTRECCGNLATLVIGQCYGQMAEYHEQMSHMEAGYAPYYEDNEGEEATSGDFTRWSSPSFPSSCEGKGFP